MLQKKNVKKYYIYYIKIILLFLNSIIQTFNELNI